MTNETLVQIAEQYPITTLFISGFLCACIGYGIVSLAKLYGNWYDENHGE